MKNYFLSITLFLFSFLNESCSQNYSFSITNSGKRVCMVESVADTVNMKIKIMFLDASQNNQYPSYVYRRALGSTNWQSVASNLPAGTVSWTDNNVSKGERWEYQVRRKNTWSYENVNYDAIGYTIGSLLYDNTNYKGQVVLLVANDVVNNLQAKYNRLKKELTADGWFVNEIIVTRASGWDSGNAVVGIRKQISDIYDAAPSNDKPKCLFILGHVPLPRSGDGTLLPSDGHEEHMGARGCDAYYADVNGVYTDVNTYVKSNQNNVLFQNRPGDFKWDQETFPSDIELAFGRVDFADLDNATSEMKMIENYLDRLSNYKNVASGFNMGDKCGFFDGYENSADASFRSLPGISSSKKLFENSNGAPHPQWVKNNGPFKIYMQNTSTPEAEEWTTYGMNATVFTSDQSGWGYGDVPQNSTIYSRIRSLLGINTKCLTVIWTTAATNVFHQAGAGEPFGFAMKTIMNHNKTNKYLEKPEQFYDHQYYWNRTHFSFYGDPTFNLFQINPPTGLTLTNVGGKAQLQWTASADNTVKGYHIYESTGEFGKFQRITTYPVKTTSYTLSNYTNGHWYMVKAVKIIESGSGMFWHPSLGISVLGNLSITSTNVRPMLTSTTINPNPAISSFKIESSKPITDVRIFDLKGKLMLTERSYRLTSKNLDISSLKSDLYICRVTYEDASDSYHKIIKIAN